MSWTPALIETAAAVASAAGLFAGYTVFAPGCQVWAPVIRYLPDARNVALTFDDGPSPQFTTQILHVLETYGVRATFFVIGSFAETYPGLLRRMAEAGHTIGNHTFSHHYNGVSGNVNYWRKEILRTSAAIFDAVGCRPRFFRPPMGFKTPSSGKAIAQLQMCCVGWSRRAFDTRPFSASAICNRATKNLRGDEILLLHDGVEPHRRGASQQQTVDALPRILEILREKNLRAVSLEAGLNHPPAYALRPSYEIASPSIRHPEPAAHAATP